MLQGFFHRVEDPLIMRLDRKRTLTVCRPIQPRQRNSSQLLQRIKPETEAIPCPRYHLNGAANESSRNAPGAVFGSLPWLSAVMFYDHHLLFDLVQRATVIWLAVPLAMIRRKPWASAHRHSFGFTGCSACSA